MDKKLNLNSIEEIIETHDQFEESSLSDIKGGGGSFDCCFFNTSCNQNVPPEP
jgi:hypothetical protein